jgi:hypothetical protein
MNPFMPWVRRRTPVKPADMPPPPIWRGPPVTGADLKNLAQFNDLRLSTATGRLLTHQVVMDAWRKAMLMPSWGLPGTEAPAQEPRNIPAPVHQDEPVYGWRGYGLQVDGDGRLELRGARMAWPGRELEAKCFGLLSIDNAATEDGTCVQHLEQDSCPHAYGCGIWGRAVPVESAVYAHCLAYGTVALDDDGNWRASNVRIEALYVSKPAVLRQNDIQAGWLRDYLIWDAISADLHARYGVPVYIVEEHSALLRAAGIEEEVPAN